ncbi:hypothetical protein SBOR_8902 [Sclerotinia borealis F-4128]|uniref:Leucine Rich Repeat domain protein n=1 Tax=Sclerotinia borealis (strain F-4128) TaxID=1432307 RepID=W9C4R0_SCLBF|nr:hypothetical protein SBOR_8902 [Sclerotinia borealis F-4128]
MADELFLPQLTRDNNTSSRFTKTNLSRKRVRDTPPPDSSDPPVFSSDDDPSVEKYAQKRRKQKFRGPWFDQRLASDSAFEDETLDCEIPIRNKRTFNKKVDSGVFMGSDGTDIEDIIMEKGKKAWPVNNVAVPSPLKSRITLDTPKDIHAQRKIEKCLEDGEEYIDLSRLALDHLENSTIRPLGTFVKAARGYAALEPSLRVILSGNLLTKLPAELFNLNRLVFLSLRDNNLQEIPPGIGMLKGLEDLNVSQNSLGYLPYEILALLVGGTLYDFQLHPNPFYLPMARSNSTENGATPLEIDLQRKWPLIRDPPLLNNEFIGRFHQGNDDIPRPILSDHEMSAFFMQRGYSNNGSTQTTLTSAGPSNPISGEKCTLSYQFRTKVRFLSTFGQCIKGPVFPSDPLWKDTGRHVQLPVASSDDIPEPPAVQSRVPTLLEIALQSCSRHPQLPHLESYMKYPPPQIPSLLRRAENVCYSGPTLCTVCKRNFVVPRTEWIEWWEIEKVSKKDRLETTSAASAASPLRRVENERDVAEKLVPLIRRGCSWLCLPSIFDPLLLQLSTKEDDVKNEMDRDTDI